MTDGMTDIPKLSDLLIGILQLVLSCDGHLTHLLPLSLQVLKLLLQHDTIVSSFMLHQQFSRPSHSILVGLPRSKLLLKSLHSSALLIIITNFTCITSITYNTYITSVYTYTCTFIITMRTVTIICVHVLKSMYLIVTL